MRHNLNRFALEDSRPHKGLERLAKLVKGLPKDCLL